MKLKKNKYYNPNNFNAVHSALAYLLFFALTALASLGLVYFVRFKNAQKPITDLAPYLCLETAIVGAVLCLTVLIVSAFTKTNPLKGGGYLPRKGLGTECLMAAVGACGLAALLSPMAESVASSFDKVRYVFNWWDGSSTTPPLESTGWLFLYSFVLVPLIPAVFEEFLVRGVIMRGFEQFGKTAAVVLSALLFSLAHGNTDQMVYQFVFGLLVGFLVMETKSLAVGASAHFANNFFVVASTIPVAMLEGKKNEQAFLELTSVMIILIGVVCVTAAFLYFGKRMLRSKKETDTNGGAVALFPERDAVAGTVDRISPWFKKESLTEKGAEPVYFTLDGKNRIKMNQKSRFLPSVLWIAICVICSIVKILVAFFGT